MRKKQFVKKVVKKIPGFLCVDDFFYIHPVEHVLSGFVCEKKPSSATIWQFTFPLFDQKNFLHLTYSRHPLDWPKYHIEYDSLVEKDLADEFVERIQPLIPLAYEAVPLEGFINFLQQDDKAMNRVHPSRRVALGYAYILLGEEDKALQVFETALKDDLVKLDRNTYADCLHMEALIRNHEMIKAQEILSLRESKTKVWLALA